MPVNNSPTILQRTITDEQSVHQHTRATDLENGNALKDLVLPNFLFTKFDNSFNPEPMYMKVELLADMSDL